MLGSEEGKRDQDIKYSNLAFLETNDYEILRL